jgi:uncharacterized protein (TIGR02001 family)
MKKLLLAAAIPLSLAAGPVLAQDSPHSFTISGWLVSDYLFRGVSQTDEDPAIQAAFDYAHESGFYAGIWGSNVDFGDTGVEYDTYIGFNHAFNDTLTGDIQLVRYNYSGLDADFEYNELIAKLTVNGMITGVLGYSNDVFNSDETGIYYGLTGSFELPNEFKLNANVGLYDLDDAVAGEDSYVDYGIGISRAFGPAEFSLGYYGTNDDGETLFGEIADDRVVATVKVAFSP